MGVCCGFIQFDTQYLKDLKRWKAQQQAKERISKFKRWKLWLAELKKPKKKGK